MQSFEVDPQSSGPALSSQRVGIVEQSLGCHFPASFINALRKANGGVPAGQFFEHLGDERAVDRFLSIIDDYKNDPLGMYDIEVVWSQIEDRLGETLVPIAALKNGDFLCLNVADQAAEPEVVLWDHERSDVDAPAATHVANSFDELVRMLHQ